MSERITKLHIDRQTERLARNLGVRVAAGQSDYKVWRCHVGGNADTDGNGYTIAVAGTARELYDAIYAANNALEFVQLYGDSDVHLPAEQNPARKAWKGGGK